MNRIFYNGKIYTMDKNDLVSEAIYVENGIIKKLGTDYDILPMKTDNTEIVDLHGNAVVPGFNDSHMHLLMYGKSLNEVNLTNLKSQAEVIEQSIKFIEAHHIKSGKWLCGFGWNQDIFDNREMLNRHDLDKISTEIPIVFTRACYHIASCNSKALEIAGITAGTHVEGGEIEIKNGEPTGVLKENAASLVLNCIEEAAREENKNFILNGIRKLSSFGITSIHTDDFGDGSYDIIDIYKEIEKENKLDVRIYQQCRFNGTEELISFIDRYKGFKCNDNYKLGPVKLLADGSLGGRTAYMNEPYSDDNTTSGIGIFTEEEMSELIKTAHDNDLSVAIHAIGDKTIDMAVKGIEEAIKNNPKTNIRHGIVHCQITSKCALEKFKENNIIAYIQPIFLATDYRIAEERIGAYRAGYSYNWKTLNDYGVKIPFGTDTPVETPNPFENIYCAVTRMDLGGKPKEGWYPEQKLTVKDSVRAYTYDSAYASYDENKKGTLEAGKFADMAVLSEDIFNIDPMKIKDIECIMTIKGGEAVYIA